MTITRAQVADLQPGDVVEIRNERWPEGTVARGPIWDDHETLRVADVAVRWPDGHPHESPLRTLTVVSRAPRPLYVNHLRNEPAPGDVVRTSSGFVYWCTTTPSWVGTRARGCETPWRSTRHGGYDSGPIYDKGLCLLVDGETGQAVQ